MSEKRDTLSIALSHEELVVAMALVGGKSMLGLELENWKKLGKEKVQLLEEAAMRALMARDVCKIGADRQLQMKPAVMAMVGACAFPEKTLVVNCKRLDADTETYFFHTIQQMNVIHTIPVTAIHQFLTVGDKKALEKAVFSILDIIDIAGSTGKTYGMIGKDFESWRELAKKSKQEAVEAFSTVIPEKETVVELVKALAKPIHNTSLTTLDKDLKPMDGFVLLKGENSVWLAATDLEEPENKISITSLSKDDLTKRVEALIRTLWNR